MGIDTLAVIRESTDNANLPADEQAAVDTLLAALTAARTVARASTAGTGLTDEQRAALTETGSPPIPVQAAGYGPAARTALQHQQILSTALTVADTAEHLQVSAGRIRQRIADHTLLTVRGARGTHRVMAVQLADGGELPGWSRIAALIPRNAHPVAIENFLLTPHVDLRDSVTGSPVAPREWLRAGYPPRDVADLVADAWHPAV